MVSSEHEQWMLAADLLHRRYLASHAVRGLRDPADIAHTLMLSTELNRFSISGVYDQPPELFHYTKLNNLFSIIASGVMRAGNAQESNDKNEHQYRRKQINDCFNHQIRSSFPQSNRSYFFKFFAENLLDHVRPTYYVSCFSSRENGRTEWGDYGDSGHGVILAMNVPNLGQKATVATPLDNATLRPITYQPEAQIEQLRIACDTTYRAVIRRLENKKPVDRDLPFIGGMGAILCSHLTWQATAFKDRFWEDEREWRMTLSLFGDASDAAAVKTGPDGRTYVELHYPDEKLPITRVIVGPLVSASDEANVRSALAKHGYQVSVTRSDAPFQ